MRCKLGLAEGDNTKKEGPLLRKELFDSISTKGLIPYDAVLIAIAIGCIQVDETRDWGQLDCGEVLT